MRIRTDDEVYRVDAVWLGPPKATFPWRARYVAWAVGIPLFLVALTVQRLVGVTFGFFSTAWAFIGTIVITRLITSKISHERPLGAVLTMWVRELMSPRERAGGASGAVTASRVRIRENCPVAKGRRRGPETPALVQYGSTQYGRQYSGSTQYSEAQVTPRVRRERTTFPPGR